MAPMEINLSNKLFTKLLIRGLYFYLSVHVFMVKGLQYHPILKWQNKKGKKKKKKTGLVTYHQE